MKAWESNILRSVARAVIAETKNLIIGLKTQKERDAIYRMVLDKHHKPISGSFTRIQLIYTIGVVKGIIKDKQ